MDNEPILPTDETISEKAEFEVTFTTTAKSIIKLQAALLLETVKSMFIYFIEYEIIMIAVISIARKLQSISDFLRAVILSAAPVLLYLAVNLIGAAIKNKKVIGIKCTYLFYNDHFRQIANGKSGTVNYSDCFVAETKKNFMIVLNIQGGVACSSINIEKKLFEQGKAEDFGNFLKSKVGSGFVKTDC